MTRQRSHCVQMGQGTVPRSHGLQLSLGSVRTTDGSERSLWAVMRFFAPESHALGQSLVIVSLIEMLETLIVGCFSSMRGRLPCAAACVCAARAVQSMYVGDHNVFGHVAATAYVYYPLPAPKFPITLLGISATSQHCETGTLFNVWVLSPFCCNADLPVTLPRSLTGYTGTPPLETSWFPHLSKFIDPHSFKSVYPT